MRALGSAPVHRIRLACGLILFTYLTTHFLNHSLGLISLDAMGDGRVWFIALWRHPLGTLALYGALLTHFSLGLWSLFRRRHLRMPAWEAWQLILGLAIPPLLISHIIGIRVAHELFDFRDSYTIVALALWELRPENGARQALVLLVAWTHGCIGLHFWLRLRPGYRRVAPLLLALAVLLPVLALLGFVQAGREVSAAVRRPGARAEIFRAAKLPRPAERLVLDQVTDGLLLGVGVSLAATILARWARLPRVRRRGGYHVTYPGGQRVAAEAGMTVLEASRLAGIPHASVCGGRGRCSTCRIRVSRGFDGLPEPRPDEVRVLERVGAPPNVRLACQLRPTGDLSVVPVLPPGASARDGLLAPSARAGEEREIAVLFADLRRFTRLAEARLPYDVVFLLNRYCETVGRGIEDSGGVVNQFTGDGVMALFGTGSDPRQGCESALGAAQGIVTGLEKLSRELAEELPAPLRVGIGIHVGPTVVGEMGYGTARYLTAVGDTVHVASRLQDLTKEYDCQLIVSDAVARHARLDVGALPRHELVVRNRAEPVVIYVVEDVRAVAPPPAG